MKRELAILSLLFAVSCSWPETYLNKAIGLMDKHGLFAEGPEWNSARENALSRRPATIDEAQETVREALEVAGGKHSFLLPRQEVKAMAETEARMPSVEVLDGNIALISLPAFSGGNEDGKRYARTVVDGVPDHIDGAIIDLRGNTGGNMYPMIASVHRFIKSGDDMLTFRNRKRSYTIPLDYVLRREGIESKGYVDCPVAILTDSLTASSGEATLICFRGQGNVRTFGSPSAGYASANTPYRMPDGSQLVLTTDCDVARTGEEFCDDPIAPDVITANPMADALGWLQSFAK